MMDRLFFPNFYFFFQNTLVPPISMAFFSPVGGPSSITKWYL
jgi:hypothetical protein